jgi:OmcA/MtrC family decaheme c-type cytochrome
MTAVAHSRARAFARMTQIGCVVALVGGIACAGPKGDQGEPGTPGAPGSNGVNGATGTPGGTGATGPQGAAGGPTGSTGATGDPGATGETGLTGATGDTGAMGDTGATGATGSPGPADIITVQGLALTIQSVSLADGVASVTFKITDANGTPLDRTGVATTGAVTTNWMIGRLGVDEDGSPGQYTSYNVKTITAPDGGFVATLPSGATVSEPAGGPTSVTQATSDSGGTYSQAVPGSGIYTYTFHTPVNPPDPTQTHTIGVWAGRPFNGQTYAADATYDFRPDGQAVTVQRQVVAEGTCNNCHNPLKAHEGERRETALCIMCHTPQTSDVFGNTVDFKVMIHKIHRGLNLPSVENGTPYQIVGYRNNISDFSGVQFPQDARNCTACHAQPPAGAPEGSPVNAFEANAWEDITHTTCFSCHDAVQVTASTTNPGTLHFTRQFPTDLGYPGFGQWATSLGPTRTNTPCATDADCDPIDGTTQLMATCDTGATSPTKGHCLLKQPHPGSDNITDDQCVLCHAPSTAASPGLIAPVDTVHDNLKFDPSQKKLAITIVSVTNTAPGQVPVVTFQVKDNTGAPADIIATPMNKLSIVVNGPTVDYAQPIESITLQPVPSSGAGTLIYDPNDASAMADAQFQYTFPASKAMASSAYGTYGFAFEGYTFASDGKTWLTIENTVSYAAVTDPVPVPRDVTVTEAKCDTCHKALTPNHGFLRADPNHCSMCHTANLADEDTPTFPQGVFVNGQVVPGTATSPSVHTDVMVHRIHMGTQLTQPYVFAGDVIANNVEFPGQPQACTTCHESLPNLPLPEGRLPSLSKTYTCTDPAPLSTSAQCQTYATVNVYTPPMTAACTGCHDSPSTLAHAETMTTSSGVEACAACHAPGQNPPLTYGIDVVHTVPP